MKRFYGHSQGTEVINTDDYRVLFRPAEHGHQAHVHRVESDRPARAIIEEITQLARTRRYPRVLWSLYPSTRPHSLGEEILALGGTIDDESALMSLRVLRVRDVDALTDYRTVISTVYKQRMPTATEIANEAEGIPQDKLGCRFVAYIDEQPVGTGAIAIRPDGSASLFGAATYPEYRGRGAYRASPTTDTPATSH